MDRRLIWQLSVELVGYLLFLYLYVTTFVVEVENGIKKAFLCVLAQEIFFKMQREVISFVLVYYSYALMVAFAGNIMFLMSFVVYHRRILLRQSPGNPSGNGTATLKQSERPATAIAPVSQARRLYVCYFTRYDLFTTILLLFIGAELVAQNYLRIDDFKPIEASIYLKTVRRSLNNQSRELCPFKNYSCDAVYGRAALKVLDAFHQKEMCCGWQGPDDWASRTEQRLPQSCCPNDTNTACLVTDGQHFTQGCSGYTLPIRNTIDPIRFSDDCYGYYPLFKLTAVIAYQFSFKRLFLGESALANFDFQNFFMSK